MIVQCPQCQTRFRIPDEKVTDRGVKVRCTRCQHTFRVNKQGPVAAAETDPFAAFELPPGPPPDQATRPGVAADAIAATRREVGESTRVMQQAETAAQLARMGLDDLLPRPPTSSTPSSVPRPPPPLQGAPVPRPPALTTELPAAEPPAGDRNALFGMPGNLDTGTLPGVRREQGASGLFEMGPGGSAPTDVLSQLPTPQRAAPDPFAPQTREGTDRFALQSGGGTDRFAVPDAEADPFAGMPGPIAPTDPFGALPGPVHPTLQFGQSAQAQQTTSGVRRIQISAPPASSPGGAAAGVDSRARSELFGSSLESPEAPLAAGVPQLLDLPAPPSAEAVAPSAATLGRVPLSARPSDAPASEVPPAASGGMRSLVVNLAVGILLLATLAAVLVASVTEGNLSAQSLREGWISRGPLVTVDVSNGVYQTAEGRPVFFVRGEVENRGSTPLRAEVKVEIFAGDERLRSGTGLAGSGVTPEDLHALETEAAALALRQRLDAEARELAPGARAPFVVAFVDHPPDLEQLRFQVTAGPAPAAAPPPSTPEDVTPEAEAVKAAQDLQ